jgi:hypothetical protein
LPILIEVYGLRVSLAKVLRRMLAPKRVEVMVSWRKSHIEEVYGATVYQLLLGWSIQGG